MESKILITGLCMFAVKGEVPLQLIKHHGMKMAFSVTDYALSHEDILWSRDAQHILDLSMR